MIAGCASASVAGTLWVDKEPLKEAPKKDDKKRRMAFMSRCHMQFSKKEDEVPVWCPCAYDFVVRHNYYVDYLAYKSKGQEMQVALRDFASMIIHECGWVDIVEPDPAPTGRHTDQPPASTK